MSFSHEDRKEVFNFFEKILLEIGKPIYYEHLRGHVNKAALVVKKYVTKKCRGENLLQFFKVRSNYFDVSLKGEVSLKKSRCRLLSYKSEKDEIYEVDCDEESIDEEVFDDSEYSVSSGYSRYDSVSSNKSPWESIEEYALSCSETSNKEKTEYEKVTIKYFCRYLDRNGKVNINSIDIENLPKKVKRYIVKYMKNKLIPFFKNNPEYYNIDEDEYVSLISPSVIENTSTSQKKLECAEDSTVTVKEGEESFDVSNAEAQTVENFISCAEFFVSVLKKKNWVPLKNVSGSLSQAPLSVSMYVKSNYETYSNFLLSASYLFTVNETEEVSLTKDCFKLLKRAKKLLRLKSNVGLWSQPVENIISGLFQSKDPLKNISLFGEERNSSVDEQLELPVMDILNEDDAFHSTNDIASGSKNAFKFPDYCEDLGENETEEVYDKITLRKTAHELMYELKKTAADLAAQYQDSSRIKEGVNLSGNFEDSSKTDDIQVYDESMLEKSAVSYVLKNKPNGISSNKEIEMSVGPVCDTFDENAQGFDIDDSCLSSNERIKKQTSRVFIECTFTVQLLCLEMIEKEKIMALNFEYEAVKYFVDILEFNSSVLRHGKGTDLNTLKGKIGQAPSGAKLFLKQMYKGEKIIQFFLKYDEFLLDVCNSWVKLSPLYKEFLEKRRVENEEFNRGIKLYEVHSLYSSHFYEVVAEVFDCLAKICCFLQNKSKTKFSRVCGSFSEFFAIHQDFFNSLIGSGISEKLEIFLLHFNKVFHFDKEYIQINHEIDVALLVSSVTEFNKKLKIFAESNSLCFYHLLDCSIAYETLPLDFEELKKNVIERVQDLIFDTYFNYSDLPNIVGYEVLHNLVLENKDSQSLIKLLEDSDLFELKNGQIFLRKGVGETEQLNDCPISHDETVNSHLNVSDIGISNSSHEVVTELIHEEKEYSEQGDESDLSLNENISSQHLDTGVVENINQAYCTSNVAFEQLPEEKEDSELPSEGALIYNKTERYENSSQSNTDIERMQKEKEDSKQTNQVNDSMLSHTITGGSQHLDSDVHESEDNSSRIVETTGLNKEKEDLETELVKKESNEVHKIGLNLSSFEEDSSNEHSNYDSNIINENLVKSESSSDNEGFKVDNENISVTKNPQSDITVQISASHDEKSAEIVKDFVQNSDFEVEKDNHDTGNKKESNEVHNIGLNLSSFEEDSSNEHSNYDSNIINENLVKSESSFDNEGFKVDNENISATINPQSDITSQISASHDEKSAEIVKDFVQNSDFEVEKDNDGTSNKKASNEVHNIGLNLSSFEEDSSNEHSNYNSNIINENLVKSESSSDNEGFKIDNENISATVNPQSDIPAQISASHDKKSAEIVKDFVQNSDFEVEKDNHGTGNKKESNEVHNIGLNLSSFDEDSSNDHSNYDSNIINENLVKSESSSDNEGFKVDTENISATKNPQSDITSQISASHDEKSAEIVNDILQNRDFEVEKNNHGTGNNSEVKRISKQSYRKDSDMHENDGNVFKFREKERATCLVKEKNFELNKSIENLNDSFPRDIRPACVISENRTVKSTQEENIVNSGIKEPLKSLISANENASGVDKENIEKNKLDEYTFVNPECASKVTRIKKNEKRSTKCDNVSGNNYSAVRNNIKLTVETRTVEGVPVFDDLKISSKNVVINQILKSKNIVTKVAQGDQIKNSVEQKLLKDINENRSGKENVKQAKDDISRNNSSSLSSVSKCSKLDHPVSTFTSSESTNNEFSVKKNQENDCKITLDCRKKIVSEESVIETNSDWTADHLKCTSGVSISDFQDPSTQNKLPRTSKAHSDSLPSCNKFSGSHELEQECEENCDKTDVSNQNLNSLFLQPLQSIVILITMDSCIAETVIEGRKKYVFCLKSSFHCDKHTDCLSCFDSLAVGDSVLCYIAPGTDYKSQNMCFSFMICKDSNASGAEPEFSFKMPSQKLHYSNNSKSSYGEENKQSDCTPQNYSSLKHIHVESKIGECQTDFSGEIKPRSSVIEKECQVKCITISRSAQTIKYFGRKLNTVEKGCQMQISSALQSTQTIYKSTESECQTVFSGAVKPYSSTDEKACQIKYSVVSKSTQAACECEENGSQTDTSDDVKTSTECQTVLCGPVKRYVNLVNKSSQTSIVPNLVCQTTQTVSQNAAFVETNQVPQSDDHQSHVNVQRASMDNESVLVAESSSQTISTGPIMIKNYYL